MSKYIFALLFVLVSFVNVAHGQSKQLAQGDFNLVKTHAADHMTFTDLIRRIEILEAENSRLRKKRDPAGNKGWWYDGDSNSWHRYSQQENRLDNYSTPVYTYYQQYSVPQYNFQQAPAMFNGGGGGCSGGT